MVFGVFFEGDRGARTLRDWAGCLVLGCGLLSASLTWAQSTNPGPGGSSSPGGESSASATEAAPNAMTRAAVQRGILQCAARVEQVTRFIGFGPQAGGMLIAPGNPVDQRLFSMQMELPAGAASNSFVDMTFTPGQPNGCGATYQAISYWSQSCDSLATSQFSRLKKSPALKQDVTVLDGGPAVKVFLMKAGPTGCVSVKKEIVL